MDDSKIILILGIVKFGISSLPLFQNRFSFGQIEIWLKTRKKRPKNVCLCVYIRVFGVKKFIYHIYFYFWLPPEGAFWKFSYFFASFLKKSSKIDEYLTFLIEFPILRYPKCSASKIRVGTHTQPMSILFNLKQKIDFSLFNR